MNNQVDNRGNGHRAFAESAASAAGFRTQSHHWQRHAFAFSRAFSQIEHRDIKASEKVWRLAEPFRILDISG